MLLIREGIQCRSRTKLAPFIDLPLFLIFIYFLWENDNQFWFVCPLMKDGILELLTFPRWTYQKNGKLFPDDNNPIGQLSLNMRSINLHMVYMCWHVFWSVVLYDEATLELISKFFLVNTLHYPITPNGTSRATIARRENLVNICVSSNPWTSMVFVTYEQSWCSFQILIQYYHCIPACHSREAVKWLASVPKDPVSGLVQPI